MSKTLQISLLGLLTLIIIFLGRKVFQKYNTTPLVSPIVQEQPMEVNKEHCRMMPDMPGCEIYNLWTGNTGTMDHAAMITDINSYLHEMIPHHQEAVDSSKILIEKTLFSWSADALQTIAQNIISGQTLEIDELKNWITDQYSGVNYVSHYMPMMRDTTGITDIPTLKKMYAEDMIVHHQGAIDMSKKLLEIMTEEDKVIRVTEEGMEFRNAIKAFANNVISAQEKEIKELQDILSTYTSSPTTSGSNHSSH